MIPLSHLLVVSALLFAIGVYGVLARRSLIAVLMSVELIFNAAAVNLVAFNRILHPDALLGQAMAILLMTVAAAEAVVGLALVIAVYRALQTTQVDRLSLLHD